MTKDITTQGEGTMHIEKKEKIVTAILEFEEAIKSQRETWYVKDAKYPSLQLWSMYVNFLHKIILIFEGNQNWKNLEIVYEKLEIEKFNINKSACLNESKQELKRYIERIKENLEIQD